MRPRWPNGSWPAPKASFIFAVNPAASKRMNTTVRNTRKAFDRNAPTVRTTLPTIAPVLPMIAPIVSTVPKAARETDSSSSRSSSTGSPRDAPSAVKEVPSSPARAR